MPDVSGMEVYWCSLCDRPHRRFRKKDGKKNKIFFDHKDHALRMSEAEVWKKQFRKSWKQAGEESKRRGEPVGAPKKDKGKKKYGYSSSRN